MGTRNGYIYGRVMTVWRGERMGWNRWRYGWVEGWLITVLPGVGVAHGYQYQNEINAKGINKIIYNPGVSLSTPEYLIIP